MSMYQTQLTLKLRRVKKLQPPQLHQLKLITTHHASTWKKSFKPLKILNPVLDFNLEGDNLPYIKSGLSSSPFDNVLKMLGKNNAINDHQGFPDW